MNIFTDQLRTTISLASTPKRIISLVPSQTELLFDLGLKDEVVGITKFCVHPKEWFRSKQRVGGTKKINFEKIKKLNPDLIIGNKEENEKSQIKELMENYSVWMSDIKTLENAYEMIAKVGEIVNRRKNSEKLISNIKIEFEKLKAEVESRKSNHKKVMYFIWKDPYMVAGGDTFIDHMLSLCGFENVFAKQKSRYPELTINDIKKTNVDLILLASEPYPFKEKHIQEMKLICPNTEIKIVDGELFSWYGSRLFKAPAYFSELIKR